MTKETTIRVVMWAFIVVPAVVAVFFTTPGVILAALAGAVAGLSGLILGELVVEKVRTSEGNK